MKLSIVIICWNDLRVIRDCLRSIYEGTRITDFEIVVSDNGSVDESVEFIRKHYPGVRIVENQQNLGFARGNNAGISASRGEYVLILNPDTIIHEGALDRLVEFADRHPKAGAFGCRVLNSDGTYQVSARLFPTVWRYWVSALGLSRLSSYFIYEEYPGWRGDKERSIDKHFGARAARRWRRLSIAKVRVRQLGYGLLNLLKPKEILQRRLEMYREVVRWNQAIDPVNFVERGEEPRLEQTSVPQVSI